MHMKRSLFNIFALTSAIVGVLLLGGYLVRFRVGLANVTPSGPTQTIQDFSLIVGRGISMLECGTFTEQLNARQGWHVSSTESYSPVWREPLDPALWGFAVQSYAIPGFNISRAYKASCPIWFLGTLCLIAPLRWLRARRNREARGFPVIQPEKH
jgi:hypothetical protein